MALVNKDAALYVPDAEAADSLLELAVKTVADTARLEELSSNILKLALPHSADIIAKDVLKLRKQS